MKHLSIVSFEHGGKKYEVWHLDTREYAGATKQTFTDSPLRYAVCAAWGAYTGIGRILHRLRPRLFYANGNSVTFTDGGLSMPVRPFFTNRGGANTSHRGA